VPTQPKDPLPERVVVADIGGTNARFAVADLGTLELSEPRYFICSDHPTLAATTRAYLDTIARPPTFAAIAVVAPVAEEKIRLTNSAWSFTRHQLCRAAGFEGLLLLNDFQALALSLPHHTGSELVKIGGGEP
jgi:glucokinase